MWKIIEYTWILYGSCLLISKATDSCTNTIQLICKIHLTQCKLDQFYETGNKYLNILTSSGKYELRVDLVDANNKKTYAVYKKFGVGDESSKFKLTVGDYKGNAGM